MIASGNYFGGRDITIGNGCRIAGTWFDVCAKIEIEDNVAFARDCVLITGSHPIGPSERRLNLEAMKSGPIVIGKGSWLGRGVLV